MEDSADEDEILQQHTQLLDDLDDLPSQLQIQTVIGTRAGTGSSTQHADPCRVNMTMPVSCLVL